MKSLTEWEKSKPTMVFATSEISGTRYSIHVEDIPALRSLFDSFDRFVAGELVASPDFSEPGIENCVIDLK
jgi:hypothetical protein